MPLSRGIRLGHDDGGSAVRFDKRLPAPAKGPRRNKFPFWGVEALGWQGAKRENAESI